MTSQITNTLFMVRPISFRKNEETAGNNYFQQDENASSDEIQERTLREFDQFVEKLRSKGVHVFVFNDRESEKTPDSIFPNNWISFHEDGSIMTYPMFAENRRLERREDVIDTLRDSFKVSNVDSLASWEDQDKFLEGTGSMILDRPNRLTYASISDRTNAEVLADFCGRTGYKAVSFTAYQSVDDERLAIYHTNVMMALGEDYAVVCLDCVDDQVERKALEKSILDSGKVIIEISESQMHQFAGNMLQVRNDSNERFTVMSQAAFNSLDEKQIAKFREYGEIISSPLPTIEKLGGGSARCMMAEVFLPKK